MIHRVIILLRQGVPNTFALATTSCNAKLRTESATERQAPTSLRTPASRSAPPRSLGVRIEPQEAKAA